MVQVVRLGSGLSREEAFRRGMKDISGGLSGLGETISRQEALARQQQKEKEAALKAEQEQQRQAGLGALQFEQGLAGQGISLSDQEREGAKQAYLTGDTSGISGVLSRRAEQARKSAEQKTAKKVQEAQKGKQLSSTEVRKISEGSAIPRMLQDIKATLEARKGDFGPIEGRLRSLNPYDVEAKSTQAQMKAAAQAFGRYMEGGVLRKEDEEKYREMFPQLSDTEEGAEAKLAIIDRLLKQKQAADLEALKSSGYDVSGLAQVGDIPDVPEQIMRQRGTTEGVIDSVIPQAVANDPQEAMQMIKQMSREEKLRFIQGK